MSCIETWMYISDRQDQISSTTDVNVTSFLFNLNKENWALLISLESSIAERETWRQGKYLQRHNPGCKPLRHWVIWARKQSHW